MYYTVYRTTNKVNGKIYIGCHKTKDLDDGYLGSGKLLGRAIEKYGIENFEKEILAVFDKSSEMFNMESELVNEDFVERDDTYNLKSGGSGGFDYINNIVNQGKQGQRLNEQLTTEQRKKNAATSSETKQRKWSQDLRYKEHVGKNLSDAIKQYYKHGNINAFKGKKHTDETKAIIGQKNSVIQKGSGNSQFGTMWITNEKKVKKLINPILSPTDGGKDGKCNWGSKQKQYTLANA